MRSAHVLVEREEGNLSMTVCQRLIPLTRRSSSNEPRMLGAMALDPSCALEVPAGADALSDPQRFDISHLGGVQESLSLKSCRGV